MKPPARTLISQDGKVLRGGVREDLRMRIACTSEGPADYITWTVQPAPTTRVAHPAQIPVDGSAGPIWFVLENRPLPG